MDIKRFGEILAKTINTCIPSEWSEYSVEASKEGRIKINKEGLEHGVEVSIMQDYERYKSGTCAISEIAKTLAENFFGGPLSAVLTETGEDGFGLPEKVRESLTRANENNQAIISNDDIEAIIIAKNTKNTMPLADEYISEDLYDMEIVPAIFKIQENENMQCTGIMPITYENAKEMNMSPEEILHIAVNNTLKNLNSSVMAHTKFATKESGTAAISLSYVNREDFIGPVFLFDADLILKPLFEFRGETYMFIISDNEAMFYPADGEKDSFMEFAKALKEDGIFSDNIYHLKLENNEKSMQGLEKMRIKWNVIDIETGESFKSAPVSRVAE